MADTPDVSGRRSSQLGPGAEARRRSLCARAQQAREETGTWRELGSWVGACRQPRYFDNRRSPHCSVFSGPWHKIVESTASLAGVHNMFAQKIADEVEKPIRDFATRNSDWAGMKSLESNLTAIAKSIQSAEDKADKLQKRGQKAKPQQVAEAASAVSNAQAEWDSQAPFVFEKLEVADEARCNNLRDALTRLQTLELDTATSTSQSAEAILGTLLDISAADETKTFANRATLGRHKLEKQHSRTGTRGSGTVATPSIITDDSVSVRSSQSGQGHGIGGLKRLGTVLRNRGNRNSIFHRSSSPDRRTGRGPPPIPPSPRRESSHPTNNDSVPQASQSTLDVPSTMDRPQPNGDTRPQTAPTGPSPPAVTVSEVSRVYLPVCTDKLTCWCSQKPIAKDTRFLRLQRMKMRS